MEKHALRDAHIDCTKHGLGHACWRVHVGHDTRPKTNSSPNSTRPPPRSTRPTLGCPEGAFGLAVPFPVDGASTGFHGLSFGLRPPDAGQADGIWVFVEQRTSRGRRPQPNATHGPGGAQLRLNRRMNLRMGMQLGFGARSIDMGGLVFMDQILRDNAATSIEQGIGGGRQYVDMGLDSCCFRAGCGLAPRPTT